LICFYRAINYLGPSHKSRERTLTAWMLLNILLIFGLSLADNFMETTRYTLLTWLSVAVWRIYTQDRNMQRKLSPKAGQFSDYRPPE
jgi:hypothetical protein